VCARLCTFVYEFSNTWFFPLCVLHLLTYLLYLLALRINAFFCIVMAIRSSECFLSAILFVIYALLLGKLTEVLDDEHRMGSPYTRTFTWKNEQKAIII
jgi:hypothetical protein